jgi:hypothetical protein
MADFDIDLVRKSVVALKTEEIFSGGIQVAKTR